MTKALKMSNFVKRFKESWVSLTDVRKKSSRLTYTMAEIAMSAFTALYLANVHYRLIRDELVKRITFFDDLRALTRYMLFGSWDHLFSFMVDVLEIHPAPT